jgi:hypothetical protein
MFTSKGRLMSGSEQESLAKQSISFNEDLMKARIDGEKARLEKDRLYDEILGAALRICKRKDSPSYLNDAICELGEFLIESNKC